jgi:hypothetical protein
MLKQMSRPNARMPGTYDDATVANEEKERRHDSTMSAIEDIHKSAVEDIHKSVVEDSTSGRNVGWTVVQRRKITTKKR